MTKDDMIRIAHEAGWEYANDSSGFDPLWKFGELIAAESAVAEREACAKTVMEYKLLYIGSYPMNEQFTDAIRARGQG
tara:strand:+ start:17432 stop:17665 length:234 start_codon:yes stop_codon:yes gene_type:complete